MSISRRGIVGDRSEIDYFGGRITYLTWILAARRPRFLRF
jgi:hypothetical protein